MTMRARSESPMLLAGEHVAGVGAGDLSSQKHSCAQALYGAVAARKKTEQDAILLANRIRLLRGEEEKARKKIQETETKTHEIIQLQQRNDIRKEERQSDALRREAEEQALREQTLKHREGRQEKIHALQNDIVNHNRQARDHVVQERDAIRQAIAQQNQEALAIAQAKHERVKAQEMGAAQIRAKSEGRNLINVKKQLEDKISREQQERQQQERAMEKMEREEAELIARLQRTHDRQRNALAKLENVMNRGSSSNSFPSSMCSGSALDSVAETTRPLDELDKYLSAQSISSSCGRIQVDSRSSLGSRSTCSTEEVRRDTVPTRPPRQPGSAASGYGGGSSAVASTSASIPSRSGRSTPGSCGGTPISSGTTFSALGGAASASREGPSDRGARKKSRPALGLARPGSPPGSASGSQGQAVSAHAGDCPYTETSQRSPSSTSRSAVPAPSSMAYITADGHRLEIPTEEDLDLVSLLNS